MLCCLQSDIKSNMRASMPTDMRRRREWEVAHRLRASDTAAVHMAAEATYPCSAPVAAAGHRAVAGTAARLHAVAAACTADAKQHIKWLIDSSLGNVTAEEPATELLQPPTDALEASPSPSHFDHSSDSGGLSEIDVTTTVAAEAPQQQAQSEPQSEMPRVTEANHTSRGLEPGAQTGSSPLDGHANQHSDQPLAMSGVCRSSKQDVTASGAALSTDESLNSLEDSCVGTQAGDQLEIPPVTPSCCRVAAMSDEAQASPGQSSMDCHVLETSPEMLGPSECRLGEPVVQDEWKLWIAQQGFHLFDGVQLGNPGYYSGQASDGKAQEVQEVQPLLL